MYSAKLAIIAVTTWRFVVTPIKVVVAQIILVSSFLQLGFFIQ